MPPAEARKFRALLNGGPARSLPGDGLPPMTLPAKAEKPRPQPVSRTECGWYYGEPCGCGPAHTRGQAKSKPVQVRLPL